MQLSAPLNFGPLQNRACIEVTINDDDMLEHQESFSVKINLTKPHSHIQIENPTTNILIDNDDGNTHPMVKITYGKIIITYIRYGKI